MAGSPDTITFRASRMKLLPALLVCLAFAVPLTCYSAMMLVLRLRGELATTWQGLLAEALVHATSALFIWMCAVTARRLVRPDSLRLYGDGIAFTYLGRGEWHPWCDVGDAEAVRRSPNSAARDIIIPLSVPKRRRIRVRGEEYDHTVDDMLSAIKATRSGAVPAPPPPAPLTAYRSIALPSAVLTFGALPALILYLYCR